MDQRLKSRSFLARMAYYNTTQLLTQDVSIAMFGRSSRSQDPFFAGLDPAQILDSLRSTRDTMLEDIDDVDPIPRARLPGSRDRLLAASQEDGFMGFIVDPHPVDRRSSHACTGLSAQARGILKRRNSSRGDAGPRDGHALARSLVSLEAGHRSGGEESDKNDVDLNERGDLADDEDGALEDQDEQADHDQGAAFYEN